MFSYETVKKSAEKRETIGPFRPLPVLSASYLFVTFIASGSIGYADSKTFSGTPTDVYLDNGNNYVGPIGAAPGSTTAVNGDLLTFNAPVNATTLIGSSSSPLTLKNSRNLGGILFDTANVGAYTINTSTSNPLILYTDQSNSTVTLSAMVTSPQMFMGSILIKLPGSTSGAYAFNNNATSSTATLNFSGTISSASNHAVALTLGGSNTGANNISGSLTNTSGSQAVTVLTKTGTGTWILSGANTFTGTGATSIANGIQINGGILVAQNNAALGTNATANTNQVSINNGGILQLADNSLTGAITLDNGLSLNLNNGGAIQSNGSEATYGRINIGSTPATVATLSTVSATDLFTVGNTANDFTGGAADTILHINGPGTILLSQASDYVGSFSLDAGVLRLGNTMALGTSANITFGAKSTGKLQLNGMNTTVGGLNTNATAPGATIVENGTVGTATLTVNNTTTNTFAGVLKNGSAGTLALSKSSSGTLTLTNANTYTGGTMVKGGTLSGNAASYGTGAITVNSGATVDYTQSGSGTAANNISGTGSATFGGNATSANGTGGTVNYTGQDSAAQTNVQSGTLSLNNPSGAALSGPVAVASGATLQLGAANQIATVTPPAVTPTVAAVTLNGGTLKAGGYSDGTINGTDPTKAAVTASMGALTLGSAGTKANPSIIAFGTSAGNGQIVLAFADSSSTLGSGYLNIVNYNNGVTALYIGTAGHILSASQLNQIAFNGIYGVSQLSNGEIMPSPEPSGMVTLLFGAGGIVVACRRKQMMKAAKKYSAAL